MNAPDPVPCELLPWDTEFFQLSHRPRLRRHAAAGTGGAQLMTGAGATGFGRLYFLARADDPATLQTAGQHGFGLVDIRLTFERVIMPSRDPVRSDPPAGVRIRPVEPGDLAGLQAIARTAHTANTFFQ